MMPCAIQEILSKGRGWECNKFMISFELSKQLKEAGFPLIELTLDLGNKEYNYCLSCGYPFLTIDDKRYLEPNLNLLIEACGDEFGELKKYPKTWVATIGYSIEGICAYTPEESVAKLWLKLNEKKKL